MTFSGFYGTKEETLRGIRMKNRVQPPRTVTESGQFPKPDLSMLVSQESPDPSTPAPTDPASITGVIPIVTEGEDAAKHKDDSASGKRPNR